MLQLPKRLFIAGEEYAVKEDSISHGMAISLLQDAVESCLWLMIKEFDCNIREQANFQTLLDAIEKAPKNTNKFIPPYKAKLIELNKARVNFKHYGNLPAASEARKFILYVDEFLKESFMNCFNIDFDQVSDFDEIVFKDVQELLKEAEKLNESRKHHDCLIECAKAKTLLFKKVERHYPKIDSKLSKVGQDFRSNEGEQLRSAFRYISNHLEITREFHIIGLIGISLEDYAEIKRVFPIASLSIGGTWHVVQRNHEATKQDADFALKLILKIALRVQSVLKEDSKSDDNAPN
jgi:hypothetical protein